MALNKIFNNLDKLNDKEKLKSMFSMTRVIDYFQEVGLKTFWKTNNKLVYLCLKILIGLFILLAIRNIEFVNNIRTDLKWSAIYFGSTLFIFTFVIIFMINFYLTVAIKDSNTDELMRRQMKYKGVDWHKEEELLKKSDE